MGKRPYGRVCEPLFVAKLGAMHDRIALPWLWARFHDRTTYLGYLRGGFQQLYERLVERISQAGGKVLLGTRVENAEPLADGRWEVQTSQGAWTVDRVISTLPTRLTCRLISALPGDYRARYDWGQAYGAQCLILSMDRQLTDSYWINPCDAGYPFTSLVEHTNFRPTSEYGGRHLFYIGHYRPMDDPLFKMKKEDILQEFLPSLKSINPPFDHYGGKERWYSQARFRHCTGTRDTRERR